MSRQVTLAIIGAGARGNCYASYAKHHPDKVKIVAVADPNVLRRERMAKAYDIPPEFCFSGYEEFCTHPKMCDAVAICTQDNLHEAPAIACAELKYDILLEKPMGLSIAAGNTFALPFSAAVEKKYNQIKEFISEDQFNELMLYFQENSFSKSIINKISKDEKLLNKAYYLYSNYKDLEEMDFIYELGL